jgi:hypothetical protein
VDLADLADRIESLPLSAAIRTGLSWRWLFPTIEATHVVAISVVFGSILLMDLRLVGLGESGNKVSRHSAELLPLTWGAFAAAVATGSLLFMANASKYVFLTQFRLKVLFILLAGLNMAAFHLGIYRRVRDWDAQMPPPIAARAAGLVSILCWTTVIFFGRWIGFVT